MQTASLESSNQTPAIQPSQELSTTREPRRETVRLLAIGSREGVNNVIHRLHNLRFAEAGSWSPLLPGPNPGEVMSILTLNLTLS
jgi:hypothetical protein